MKGLPKPIINSIIDHLSLDVFGEFMLMSRSVMKLFERFGNDIANMNGILRLQKILVYVSRHTNEIWFANLKNREIVQYINKKIEDEGA
jgi:ligand-binding sensor domain-containing protein